ncbi:hypothetical protein NKH77_54325 [Streptomyces sp. M19]
MKFTDGYWLMREGVRASYAAEVAEVRAEDAAVTLFAPVRHVETGARRSTARC